jgi:hypothetical protein
MPVADATAACTGVAKGNMTVRTSDKVITSPRRHNPRRWETKRSTRFVSRQREAHFVSISSASKNRDISMHALRHFSSTTDGTLGSGSFKVAGMYVDRAEPPNLPHDLPGCKASIPWRHSDTSFTLRLFTHCIFCAVRMLQVKQRRKPPSPRVMADELCHYDASIQSVDFFGVPQAIRGLAWPAKTAPVFVMRLGVTACAFSSPAPAGQALASRLKVAEMVYSWPRWRAAPV